MCWTCKVLFPTQESRNSARTIIIENNNNCRTRHNSFGKSTKESSKACGNFEQINRSYYQKRRTTKNRQTDEKLYKENREN